MTELSPRGSRSPRLVEMPDIFSGAEKKKRPATVTILKPLSKVYALFRDLSYFALVFYELDRVEEVSTNVHRWFAKGDATSWDTQLLLDEPQRIAWRSKEDASVNMIGALTFEPALGGRATIVSLKVAFPSPMGALANFARKFKGEDADTQAAKSLRYLKALLETGEIPSTQGQPSGREESAAA